MVNCLYCENESYKDISMCGEHALKHYEQLFKERLFFSLDDLKLALIEAIKTNQFSYIEQLAKGVKAQTHLAETICFLRKENHDHHSAT